MEPVEPTSEAQKLAPAQVAAAVSMAQRISENVRRAVKVRDEQLSHMIVSLLAEGHVLVEDYPGVGKTALARALSRSIECQFARVQCTVDLLPADIVGTNVYNQREDRFEFRSGFDLDASGLAAMLARVAPAAVEVIAHLHAPMFHTAHCLWAANLPGGANCADCKPLDSARDERLDSARDERPCRQHRIRLRDRNGEEHAVTLDPCGRNTVFASRPRTAAGSLTELSRAGVRHFRVELLEESGEEARRLICLRQAQGLQWRP